MDFLKWLKGLIRFDLHGARFNLKLFSGINIAVDNSKKIVINDNRPVISWKHLSPKEQRELLSFLPSQLKQGLPLLESGFHQTVSQFSSFSRQPEYRDSTAYFIDKLPGEDILILKASLYLKWVLSQNMKTDRLKQDIVERYGVRGKNISNLCTAGYFETVIKPLFEEMKLSPGFTVEKFLQVYEEIVTHYPFAIFIHRHMNSKTVEILIKKKIEDMEKYGISSLNIHGIGKYNVRIIKKAIRKLKGGVTFTEKIELREHIIVATVKRNRPTLP